MSTKRITERAVLDAAEIKKFALQRAQQDVMAKLTPAIMKKIEADLKLLAEQQDPFGADPNAAIGASDPVPPTPPAPSPDAGATAPVTPAPDPGATVTDPAVAAASTPIGAPTQQVLGKIETNPESGGQELVIPIDSLFQQADATGATPPAPETPIDPTAVVPPTAAPGTPELSPTPGDPGSATAATPTEEMPLAERNGTILAAIDKLLENIAAPANPVPESAPGSVAVPGGGEGVLDVNATVAGASENKMYESFKKILTAAEEVSATGAILSKKTVDSLRGSLEQMRTTKVITERLWKMNTRKLDLLENGIRKASNSYRKEETQENMATATKPNKKPQSLKDFALKLFEGAEGFEKEVGKVDPAGDAKGLSDEHAKKASGNPKNVKAEAEKAPFKHPAEEGDQGKALLEEIEKEINELMASMSGDEAPVMEQEEEEGADAPPVADAGAEGEEILLDDEPGAEDPNAMTITIDLQGVSGDAVENVNVQLDGKPVGGDGADVDVDVDDMAGGEEMSVDMAAGAGGDEDEMMVVAEVRRLVREQMEALGLKTNKKAIAAKPAAAKPAAKPQAVNEVAELTKQLDETRVLTARSLFLNKILVSEASLTESQRRKIVEYLDAGNTVNEVKEIYGKIVKAINKNKAKATAPAGSLNESANINGKQIRQVSDLMTVPMFDADRWSKLAGIGKGR